VQDLARHSPQRRNPLPVKETCAINKSLNALTNVIMALSQDEQKWRRQIPGGSCQRRVVNYRDSKLTLLLRDSLGGRSQTAVVANVSPSAACSMETLSTLRFAARAKRIRCNVLQKEADVSYSAAAMESMAREVVFLRKRVHELENAASKCSRVLVESTEKLAEVGARLHVAAQATQDAAIPAAGGAAVRARSSSPSLGGSATVCDPCNGVSQQVLHRSGHAVSMCQLPSAFLLQSSSPSLGGSATVCDPCNGVSQQVLHRSGHAVSMCQLPSAFVSQSPTFVSRCCSPLLVSRQGRAPTACVASTWYVSPRAQSPPRHRCVSPYRSVFLETATQPSMHGRLIPRAFGPLVAPSTQHSWGAVGGTQRWAHI